MSVYCNTVPVAKVYVMSVTARVLLQCAMCQVMIMNCVCVYNW